MLRFVFTFGLGLCIAGCNGGFKPNDDSNTDDVPCEDGVDCPEDCGDGTDNDGDGNTDCSDSDCSDSESCVEDCYDGIDNDGDTFVDCDDADCAGQCTEDCTDNIDNDGDGAVDCDDTDCDGDCPEVCDDGRDNDGDGAVDCDDTDCDGSCPEVCDDDRDNDGDGLIDCLDDDCAGEPECIESDCTDGIDNDEDGLTDCEDGDCADSGECAEDCYDNADNDGDGLVDCMDDDCWGLTDCHPDGVISSVLGGTNLAVQSSFTRSSVFNSTCASYGYHRTITNRGAGYSMYGTVQTKPRGATTWVTCDWAVGTVSFSHENQINAPGFSSFTTTSTFGPVIRNNAYVQPGCALPTTATWFLPQKLQFEYYLHTVKTPSGKPWYQGTYFSTNVTSTVNTDSACSTNKFEWFGTYSFGNIYSGSTYLAYE